MTNMSENQKNWEEIYKNSGFLKYPNESLVVSYHRLKAQLPAHVTALDYGFGSGNNSEFIIDNVDAFYGIEVSAKAKEITSARLRDVKHFNADNLFLVENEDIPGFEDKFDLIVAWHVISYNSHESVQKVISRLRSYLKPGGFLITTLATPRDISKMHSTKESHNTYVLTDGIPDQVGCQVIIPEHERDFIHYFSGFKVIDSGHFERISFCSDHSHSHYFGVFQK